MRTSEILAAAPGLQKPWFINKVEFKSLESLKKEEFHSYLAYDPGHSFEIGNQTSGRIYDHHAKQWRHANFFFHL